jgi:hypothetical protein
MALMGIREYGRHRGVSHVAVLKALRSGRIRETSDGLIDSEQADRDWARNTHPAPRTPRLARAVTGEDGGYSAARTVREHFVAKLLKHEYEQRAAGLVNADEVKVAAYRVRQAFCDRMGRIPGAVAKQVAGEMDECRVHAILADAIREALIAFADEHA